MTSDRRAAPVCGAHARDPARLGRGLVSRRARHHGVPRRGLPVTAAPGRHQATTRTRRSSTSRPLCGIMKGGEKRFGLGGWAIGNEIAKEGLMGIDDKADNKAEELKGKGKETIGDATDDEDLQAKGRAQEAKGSLKQAGEKVKDAFKG